MLSKIVRSNLQQVAFAQKTAVRSFGLFDVSKERSIPKDIEFSWGRRLKELLAEKEGLGNAFESDDGALVPPANQGTKQNPIMVKSSFQKRAVGYKCPMTHQLVWFNLERGPVHFLPEVNLYFKMEVVEPDDFSQ